MSTNQTHQLTSLTDTEWMQLIDQTADGLPYCCGNISALRDTIISIARFGREYTDFIHRDEFVRHYQWVVGSHERLPIVEKLFAEICEVDPEAKLLLDRLEAHDREREFK